VAESNAHLSLTAATAARVAEAIGAKPGDNGLADFCYPKPFPMIQAVPSAAAIA
jgi:hypothetical protein